MTLVPDVIDFDIWRGATFNVEVTLYTDGAGTEPWDLTGYTALMEIRDQPGDEDPIFVLSTDDDTITLDSEGVITLNIEANDTATLTWKRGVYDLLITSPSGKTDPVLWGKVKVVGV